MKRRLVLCALATLLSLSTLASRPASAGCTPRACNFSECNEYCIWLGYSGGLCDIDLCESHCHCYY
jgi:hypothetical protein